MKQVRHAWSLLVPPASNFHTHIHAPTGDPVGAAVQEQQRKRALSGVDAGGGGGGSYSGVPPKKWKWRWELEEGEQVDGAAARVGLQAAMDGENGEEDWEKDSFQPQPSSRALASRKRLQEQEEEEGDDDGGGEGGAVGVVSLPSSSPGGWLPGDVAAGDARPTVGAPVKEEAAEEREEKKEDDDEEQEQQQEDGPCAETPGVVGLHNLGAFRVLLAC